MPFTPNITLRFVGATATVGAKARRQPLQVVCSFGTTLKIKINFKKINDNQKPTSIRNLKKSGYITYVTYVEL